MMESDNVYGIQAGCGGITLRVTSDAARQSPAQSNSMKVKKSPQKQQFLIKSSSAVATFQSTKNVTATDVIDPTKFA